MVFVIHWSWIIHWPQAGYCLWTAFPTWLWKTGQKTSEQDCNWELAFSLFTTFKNLETSLGNGWTSRVNVKYCIQKNKLKQFTSLSVFNSLETKHITSWSIVSSGFVCKFRYESESQKSLQLLICYLLSLKSPLWHQLKKRLFLQCTCTCK